MLITIERGNDCLSVGSIALPSDDVQHRVFDQEATIERLGKEVTDLKNKLELLVKKAREQSECGVSDISIVLIYFEG